ncbi:mycothiol-dependent nitroreductase Rv2466c family protein [Jidongwangia harbinensis]|uniref:mycothiol-dependent nitroreductase Rv2466c family protein n=1 Tax=Jidongwangia harbinensis TaxID=2878561 RepID=UPI001CD92227|nr:DsbA family protein [Jidongwangia harbinensis]MCA2218520.1 DsbA family protein [Jidongwangia harbinensis]
MEATYYFDPACPFTWRTSRWLVGVAAERDVTVHWRAFSLTILSGGNAPEEYRSMMAAASRALRLVEALAADQRNAEAGAFYTELGTRTHDAGVPLSDDIVAASAEAAGLEDVKAILDDPSWDEAVRASHEKAFASAGPDIGSPVLWIEGAPRAVHGPILSEVPDHPEALAIWDAVVPLAHSGTFFELKRGRG